MMRTMILASYGSKTNMTLADIEAKAWDSLARYKFIMFGYWAAIWVHTNRETGARRPNPFKELVQAARSKR